ncbi:tRNA (guanosine(37)-N1)-methyltransferase TrmD [Candidatus Shapirobacteria bacterium CG03_land_8_20_14_0_80_39_12]|uniref:tRNA (guanine-N(1)-)-methyltransferase n=1 Tax=Candidatus Shapirobacteria bacterium CG03_land_8_20_14_0_80_39_12 TaxID=1974879 RepID=A0A2M7BAQ4_9BACT|nr:MAG: tRNA (guanosine(37)-N1)-methyltransferase TrmD [Candidatus Shapirobacteria bacterium CG03_land_8_20_14_0_80_39_12]
MMEIDILTLFPAMFKGPFDESILRRAQDKSLVQITIYNLRRWTDDKRGTVDDRPYGGGVGMVMMAAPIVKAIEEVKRQKLKGKSASQNLKVILLSPRGKVWKQEMALEYSKFDHLILICGHYEGVDERVREFIDEEISIGDYVLTGGEIPSMAIVDSIVRLIPGVLEKPDATNFESFSKSLNPSQSKSLLEYPQYTHPEDFRGLKVPSVLLSGDHGEIEKWRNEKALEITKKNRPDLIKD